MVRQDYHTVAGVTHGFLGTRLLQGMALPDGPCEVKPCLLGSTSSSKHNFSSCSLSSSTAIGSELNFASKQNVHMYKL
jgi:hypothetical protein